MVDETRNEVRVSIAVADLARVVSLRRGDRLTRFLVSSHRFAGPSAYHEAFTIGWTGLGIETDWAAGGSYTAGTKSCVKPGS